MRLLGCRFVNIEDEIVHIIIAIASTSINKDYFNKQVEDLYGNYNKKVVDNCIDSHKDLINRLIEN